MNRDRWNSDTESWEDYARTNSDYNDEGKLLEEVIEFWMVNDWFNSIRNSYTYIDGEESSFLRQNWNTNINDWVNSYQIFHELDEDGNPLKTTYQDWIIDAWVNRSMVNSNYDENGNQIFFVDQIWVDTAWQNRNQNMQTFDEYDNRITQWTQVWDTTAVDWVNSTHYTYYYDMFSNTEEMIDPIQVKLSPNPNSGDFQLSFDPDLFSSDPVQIIIYNQLGQAVRQWKLNQVNSPLEINQKGLAPGMYYLNIRQQNRSLSKQLLIGSD